VNEDRGFTRFEPPLPARGEAAQVSLGRYPFAWMLVVEVCLVQREDLDLFLFNLITATQPLSLRVLIKAALHFPISSQ